MRVVRAILPALLIAAGASCTGGTPTAVSSPSPSVVPSAPASLTPVPSPTPHPVSLPALMQRDFDGRNLRLGRVLARNSAYTRYYVTYASGRLTISGVMNVPRGAGPFPVVVLNHGYRDVATYVNGEGLAREQDYLARHGYVAFHVDFRNHAQSTDDPRYEMNLRLGYVEDAINAVLAVKSSTIPHLDRDRVGMLGRSMGGGVTLGAAVVKPELLKAIVLYSSVSSDYVDNYNKWTRTRAALAKRIEAAYGSPSENPEFWRNVSAINFVDRVTMPVLMHHGTRDSSTPLAWSERTLAALEAKGKDADLLVYRGQPHVFTSSWTLSMQRTVAFLDRHLKA